MGRRAAQGPRLLADVRAAAAPPLYGSHTHFTLLQIQDSAEKISIFPRFSCFRPQKSCHCGLCCQAVEPQCLKTGRPGFSVDWCRGGVTRPGGGHWPRTIGRSRLGRPVGSLPRRSCGQGAALTQFPRVGQDCSHPRHHDRACGLLVPPRHHGPQAPRCPLCTPPLLTDRACRPPYPSTGTRPACPPTLRLHTQTRPDIVSTLGPH